MLLPAGWNVFGPVEATQQGFSFYALGPNAGSDGGPEISQIIVADAALTPEQFLQRYCPACAPQPFEAVTIDGVLGTRTTLGGEATPETPWTFVVHNGHLLGFSIRSLGDQTFEWVLGTITLSAATQTPTDTPVLGGFVCSLAYASGSQVFCLGEGGTPILLADHGADVTVSDTLISDDGAWVAYLVNKMAGLSELWAVNVSGLVGNDGLGLPREILADPSQFTSGGSDIAISPMRPQWQAGTHNLFFSTRFTPLSGEIGPGEYRMDDLWRVNADNPGPFNLLPRQSIGNFQLSPDGQHLAIATTQAILLANADASNLTVILEFPFINTASEAAYRPALVWSPDSTFFSAVVPSAEPLAADAHADIFLIGTDTTVRKPLTLQGNFVFGLQIPPTVSPDGRFVVYATITQPEVEPPLGDVHLISVETQEHTIVALDGLWTGLGWSPDSERYTYARYPVGESYLVKTNGAIQTFGVADIGVSNIVWADALSFYFIGGNNEQAGLYFQRLDEPAQKLADGFVNYAAFDARP